MTIGIPVVIILSSRWKHCSFQWIKIPFQVVIHVGCCRLDKPAGSGGSRRVLTKGRAFNYP
jgi:hypothetical protein